MDHRVIFMSIGTGNPAKLEETLYTPLGMSLTTDAWHAAVLLPSLETRVHAEELARRYPDVPIRIAPLPAARQEDNPDACFDHFDREIAAVLGAGIPADRCVADITRGTKAMSAALAMAAVRHEIPVLRYITGERDKANQGNIRAGTEDVVNARTLHVTARRKLDAALRLFRNGSFAGVATLIEDPAASPDAVPEGMRPWFAGILALAGFYGAWDRLDFGTAAARAPAAGSAVLPPGWEGFDVDEEAAGWLRSLAAVEKAREKELRDGDMPAFARHVGRLTAELIANGRRRIAQEQFEDASLRVYRCTELLGQAHLFARGHDTEFMDPEDPEVAKFAKKKKGMNAITESRRKPEDGAARHLSFAREAAVLFLRHLKVPAGEMLHVFGNEESVKARNTSLLIHGFQATGPRDAAILAGHFDKLEAFLRDTFPDEAPGWMAMASRVPYQSREPRVGETAAP
ncbi:TIGR02710 family CRISPR-associated protein [Skermanella sp. TT6]|uniref:TIGR02710 family CRISPR-associated protein n=1 Tax=Skermanella cutis TaxID=2775420 RepID=A0ABX7BCS5_9PROT|nr:TIGR02710 family CRISPR-associated CARF protein [Skermanella sp. TT6]QQP92186.1 TIGR02710 family CRISPR-associated protein [Skermanella sp. TT6]